MTINISGFGTKAILRASISFPTGFTISQWAHDVDPIEINELPVGDGEMNVNGTLVTWSKATRVEVNLSVVPTSQDDVNLSILLNAARPGVGKLVIPDLMTLILIYPITSLFSRPRTFTYTNGKIISGTLGNALTSTGMLKSKTYNFIFEQVSPA